MKLASFIGTLVLLGSSYACGGHDDAKEWSREELEELDRKWGFEV